MWIVVAYLVRRPARVRESTTTRLAPRLRRHLRRSAAATVRRAPALGRRRRLRPPDDRPRRSACASFLALGRSFGFAAADRGLVQRGPYSVVRHPIYASYFFLQIGYLLQSLSLRNALIMVFICSCNIGRAVVEERLLVSSSRLRASIDLASVAIDAGRVVDPRRDPSDVVSFDDLHLVPPAAVQAECRSRWPDLARSRRRRCRADVRCR